MPVEFVREFQQETIAQTVPTEFFETIVRESLKVPARIWKAVFSNLIATDNIPELHKIDAPTLILWGEEDAFFSHKDQAVLLENIPDAKLITYTEVGHSPHWEKPEKVAGDLLSFINKSVAEKSYA